MKHIFLAYIAYGLLNIFSLNLWSGDVEKEDEQTDEACPICLEEYDNDTKKPLLNWECGHPVCSECLVPLIDKNAPCPLCRAESKNKSNAQTPSPLDTLLVGVKELNAGTMELVFNLSAKLVRGAIPFKPNRTITLVDGNTAVTLTHTKHDQVDLGFAQTTRQNVAVSITQTFSPSTAPQCSSVSVKKHLTGNTLALEIGDTSTTIDLQLLRHNQDW